MKKKFEFEIDGHNIIVDLDKEGDCRFMARMTWRGSLYHVRIGYIFGFNGAWTAEPSGAHAVRFRSAKDGCLYLAERSLSCLFIQKPGIPS